MENSIRKIIEWAEKGCVLTRFGVAKVISRTPHFVDLSFVYPQNKNQPESISISKIFPIYNDMIISIANLTHPTNQAGSYLGWGRFVEQSSAAIIWEDSMPDQTNHWIQWNQGAIIETNKQLLSSEEERPTVIIEAWLDRIAPVKVEQFSGSVLAINSFLEYEESFRGVACGIFIRLVIDFDKGKVIGLSLYGDIDQILPINYARL